MEGPTILTIPDQHKTTPTKDTQLGENLDNSIGVGGKYSKEDKTHE